MRRGTYDNRWDEGPENWVNHNTRFSRGNRRPSFRGFNNRALGPRSWRQDGGFRPRAPWGSMGQAAPLQQFLQRPPGHPHLGPPGHPQAATGPYSSQPHHHGYQTPGHLDHQSTHDLQGSSGPYGPAGPRGSSAVYGPREPPASGLLPLPRTPPYWVSGSAPSLEPSDSYHQQTDGSKPTKSYGLPSEFINETINTVKQKLRFRKASETNVDSANDSSAPECPDDSSTVKASLKRRIEHSKLPRKLAPAKKVDSKETNSANKFSKVSNPQIASSNVFQSKSEFMRRKILQKLFQLDKKAMRNLLMHPKSSSKYDFAVESLITETRTAISNRLRSIAEKSLSLQENNAEDKQTAQDAFMGHLGSMLDTDASVELSNMEPQVIAELSKVLQEDLMGAASQTSARDLADAMHASVSQEDYSKIRDFTNDYYDHAELKNEPDRYDDFITEGYNSPNAEYNNLCRRNEESNENFVNINSRNIGRCGEWNQSSPALQMDSNSYCSESDTNYYGSFNSQTLQETSLSPASADPEVKNKCLNSKVKNDIVNPNKYSRRKYDVSNSSDDLGNKISHSHDSSRKSRTVESGVSQLGACENKSTPLNKVVTADCLGGAQPANNKVKSRSDWKNSPHSEPPAEAVCENASTALNNYCDIQNNVAVDSNIKVIEADARPLCLPEKKVAESESFVEEEGCNYSDTKDGKIIRKRKTSDSLNQHQKTHKKSSICVRRDIFDDEKAAASCGDCSLLVSASCQTENTTKSQGSQCRLKSCDISTQVYESLIFSKSKGTQCMRLPGRDRSCQTLKLEGIAPFLKSEIQNLLHKETQTDKNIEDSPKTSCVIECTDKDSVKPKVNKPADKGKANEINPNVDEVLERMKQIDNDIHILVLEKLKLYSVLETPESTSNHRASPSKGKQFDKLKFHKYQDLQKNLSNKPNEKLNLKQAPSRSMKIPKLCPSKEKSSTTNSHTGHHKKSTLHREVRESTRRHKSVASENKGVASEHKSVASEHKSVTSEHKSVTSEHKSVPSEHKSVPSEHKSVPSEHKSVPSEHKSVPSEHKSVPSEHKSVPSEHKSVPSEYRSASDEYRNKSASSSVKFKGPRDKEKKHSSDSREIEYSNDFSTRNIIPGKDIQNGKSDHSEELCDYDGLDVNSDTTYVDSAGCPVALDCNILVSEEVIIKSENDSGVDVGAQVKNKILIEKHKKERTLRSGTHRSKLDKSNCDKVRLRSNASTGVPPPIPPIRICKKRSTSSCSQSPTKSSPLFNLISQLKDSEDECEFEISNPQKNMKLEQTSVESIDPDSIGNSSPFTENLLSIDNLSEDSQKYDLVDCRVYLERLDDKKMTSAELRGDTECGGLPLMEDTYAASMMSDDALFASKGYGSQDDCITLEQLDNVQFDDFCDPDVPTIIGNIEANDSFSIMDQWDSKLFENVSLLDDREIFSDKSLLLGANSSAEPNNFAQVKNNPVSKKGDFCDAISYTDHCDSIVALKCVGDNFLAASMDGNVYYYSTTKKKALQTMKVSTTSAITCLTLKPNRVPSQVYTGSLDSYLRCFNFKTGEKTLTDIDIGGPIQSMFQEWRTLYIGTQDGLVVQFDIEKGAVIPNSSIKCSENAILALHALKEGPRKVLLVASRSQEVTVKDATSGLLLRTLHGPDNTVYSLLFHAGKVFCGTSGPDLQVFDFANGDMVELLRGGRGAVCLQVYRGLLFSGCYDGLIYVFRVSNCKDPVARIPGPGKMMLAMAILNNKIIAGCNDKSLSIWPLPKEVIALLDT